MGKKGYQVETTNGEMQCALSGAAQRDMGEASSGRLWADDDDDDDFIFIRFNLSDTQVFLGRILSLLASSSYLATKVTYQVMRLSRLYEVNVGAGVNVDHASRLVCGQQQSIISALVGQAGQEL